MSRPWRRFLAAASTAAVVTAFIGATAQAAVLLVVIMGSIAIMIRGVRSRDDADPWLWYGLSVTGSLFLLAGALAEVLHGGPTPAADYPQVNDFIDAVAYLIAIASMYRAVRTRPRDTDPTRVLDSLILPGGVVVVVWMAVVVPNLENEQLSELGRNLNVGFSVLSLTLTAIVGEFVMSPTRRGLSFHLLGVGAVGALGGDILASVELSGRSFTGSEQLALLVPTIGFAGVGAAALHPSAASVTRPTGESIPRLTPLRLVTLAAAAVVAPSVLLWEQYNDAPRYATVVVIGISIALVLLIMSRMAGLVRARERVAESDRILTESAEALVAATDSHAMYRAALSAIERIVDARRITILSREHDRWVVAVSTGDRAAEVAVDPQLAAAGSPFGSILRERHTATVCGVAAPDLAGDVAEHCTVAPLVAADQLTGAILVTTAHHPERQATVTLASLSSDLSLALEGAARTAQIHRQQSERRFRSLIENSRDLVLVVDDDLVPTFVTPAVSRTLGYEDAVLTSSSFLDHIAEEDRPRFLANLGADPATTTSTELRIRDAIGSLRWFDVVVANLTHDSRVGGVVITARDVHGRKLADQRTARSQARFRALVQHASEIVGVLDMQGDITYVSPSAESVLGYRQADLEGSSVLDIVHASHRESIAALMVAVAENPGRPHKIEVDVVAADGSVRTLVATASDLRDEPAINGVVINAYDITERMELERSLRHQALHDDLTGIPNRSLFRDRVEQALTRRNPGLTAVMVLDLDDFKTVNDSLGHQAGDDLLQILAFRLRQVLRVGDTAARMGGDEFAVLVEDAHDRAAVLEIADRLIEKMSEPFDVEDRELVVGASIGVVFAQDISNVTAEAMIRSADAAMHAAKARGKARYSVFEEAMYLGAMERLGLKADLARALERRELVVHYQPIVDLAHGSLAGYEALLRWNHPDRGPISPGAFIPLAEETGLIVPIGRWVLAEAVKRLDDWQRTRGEHGPLTMSVNVSPRQLESDSVVADIADILDGSGIDPSQVAVELTETSSLAQHGLEATRLRGIRDLGCQINADDFGTGYASYASLRELPFTGVKIDRSLIDGITGQQAERARAQVRSMIEMGAELGLKVVAEGIETIEQVTALRAMHCRLGQGYYFGRPSPSGQLERLPTTSDRTFT